MKIPFGDIDVGRGFKAHIKRNWYDGKPEEDNRQFTRVPKFKYEDWGICGLVDGNCISTDGKREFFEDDELVTLIDTCEDCRFSEDVTEDWDDLPTKSCKFGVWTYHYNQTTFKCASWKEKK